MKHLISYFLVAVAVVSGCDKSLTTVTTDKSTTSYALIVGVADGRVAGPCPGSDVDANNFEVICNSKNIKSTKLITAQATFDAVKSHLETLCSTYDTAIFYYSGHGGRTKNFNPYVGEEADNADDFLCLYDKGMLDDDIWKIISKAKGRVICVFDCCHSETLYRAPMFTDKIKFGAPIMTNFVDAVNIGGIFVLSGSPEDKYSYGSPTGGELTNAIRKHQKNKTYAELFDALENDKTLRSYQIPMCTVINNFNTNIEFLQ